MAGRQCSAPETEQVEGLVELGGQLDDGEFRLGEQRFIGQSGDTNLESKGLQLAGERSGAVLNLGKQADQHWVSTIAEK
jgi:hypothetical protein